MPVSLPGQKFCYSSFSSFPRSHLTQLLSMPGSTPGHQSNGMRWSPMTLRRFLPLGPESGPVFPTTVYSYVRCLTNKRSCGCVTSELNKLETLPAVPLFGALSMLNCGNSRWGWGTANRRCYTPPRMRALVPLVNCAVSPDVVWFPSVTLLNLYAF